jgi:hypothetical protein
MVMKSSCIFGVLTAVVVKSSPVLGDIKSTETK